MTGYCTLCTLSPVSFSPGLLSPCPCPCPNPCPSPIFPSWPAPLAPRSPGRWEDPLHCCCSCVDWRVRPSRAGARESEEPASFLPTAGRGIRTSDRRLNPSETALAIGYITTLLTHIRAVRQRPLLPGLLAVLSVPRISSPRGSRLFPAPESNGSPTAVTVSHGGCGGHWSVGASGEGGLWKRRGSGGARRLVGRPGQLPWLAQGPGGCVAFRPAPPPPFPLPPHPNHRPRLASQLSARPPLSPCPRRPPQCPLPLPGHFIPPIARRPPLFLFHFHKSASPTGASPFPAHGLPAFFPPSRRTLVEGPLPAQRQQSRTR